MPAPSMILIYWERAHGTELDDELSRRFMARPEVQELSKMPTDVVIDAITSHKRLADAIVAARKLAEAYTPTKEDEWRPTYRPTQKAPPTLRGIKPQLFPNSPGGITGAPGTPGASASYGSGLAHNPGVAEAAIGERCSSCDAWVPDGVYHDCG